MAMPAIRSLPATGPAPAGAGPRPRLPRPARLRRAAGAVLVASLSACAGPAPAPAPAPAPPTVDPYAQTGWSLVRWSAPDGRLRALPRGSSRQPVTLVFTREQGQGRVSGFAGCNRYLGGYTAANAHLVFTVPATTRMACIPPQRQALEQAYLAALARVNGSSLDDTAHPRELRLSTDQGETLVFERQADPIAGGQGVRRLVYVDSLRVPCETGGGRALCYRVRDSAGQPWQVWRGDIAGFVFQPGIAYRLRVVEVPAVPPTAADGGVRWVLDTVVEQAVAAPARP